MTALSKKLLQHDEMLGRFLVAYHLTRACMSAEAENSPFAVGG